MFRSALSRRIKVGAKFPGRPFHTNPRPGLADGFVNDIVELCASRAYEFHHLFQYLHDSAGLPLVASIPLATVLVRSLVTPFRYYLAVRRQEQCDIFPQLRTAANLIANQSERRVVAGVDTKESAEVWKRGKWELKLKEFKRRYLRAEPTILVNPESSFDAASIAAMTLVLANTSTILSQSMSHPETLGLHILDGYSIPLAICVPICLWFNNLHYYDRTHSSGFLLKKTMQVMRLDASVWNEAEMKFAVMALFPISVALYITVCPPAVALSLFSSVLYTALERMGINALVESRGKTKLGISKTSYSAKD